MKKRNLLLVLASGMLLAACGEVASSVVTPSEGDTHVIDTSIIQANVIAPSKVKANVATDFRANFTADFDKDVVDTSLVQHGLVVKKDAKGLVGFYSLYHGDYLIAPQFEYAWLNYGVYTDNAGHVPYYLYLQYEGLWYVADAFGNLLAEKADANPGAPVYNVINDELYLSIGSGSDRTHWHYDSNGKATKVDVLPDANYAGPSAGEKYAGSTYDLADYGKEGYRLLVTAGGTYVLYKDNAFVRATNLESGENAIALFDGKILVQRTYELPTEATDYDCLVPTNTFYSDPEQVGTKYRIETAFVDLETGARTQVAPNILFSGAASPILNEKGIISYYSASFYQIPENKIIAPRYLTTRVIDSSLVIHDKVTDIMGIGMQQLDDTHYYSASTGIIFDAAHNPITDLGNLGSRSDVPNAKGFLGTYNGLYGFVGYDGKVKAEFKYNQIYATDVLDNKVIAVRSGKCYRVDLSTGEETFLSDNATRIAANIYRMETKEEHIFFSSAKELGRVSKENLTAFATSNINLLNGNAGVSVRATYTDPDTNAQSVKFLFAAPETIKIGASTVGALVDGKEYQDGTTFDERETVTYGDNIIHSNRLSGTHWVQFEAKEDGEHMFFLQSSDSLSQAYEINFDEETGEASRGAAVTVSNLGHQIETTTYSSAKRMTLHAKDETHSGVYAFLVNSAYTWHSRQMSKFRIEYGEGYYSNAPLEIDPESSSVKWTASEVVKPVKQLYTKVLYKGVPGEVTLTSADSENPLVDADPITLTQESGDQAVTLNFKNEIEEKEATINVAFAKEELANNSDLTAKEITYGEETSITAKYAGLSEKVYTKFKSAHAGRYKFSVSGTHGADEDSLTTSYAANSNIKIFDAEGVLEGNYTLNTSTYYAIPEGGYALLGHNLYTVLDEETKEAELSKVTVTVVGLEGFSFENPMSIAAGQTINSTSQTTSTHYIKVSSTLNVTMTLDKKEIAVTYYCFDAEGKVIGTTQLVPGENTLEVAEGTDHGIIVVTKIPTTNVSSNFTFVAA